MQRIFRKYIKISLKLDLSGNDLGEEADRIDQISEELKNFTPINHLSLDLSENYLGEYPENLNRFSRILNKFSLLSRFTLDLSDNYLS